jgi:hypothetical protein
MISLTSAIAPEAKVPQGAGTHVPVANPCHAPQVGNQAVVSISTGGNSARQWNTYGCGRIKRPPIGQRLHAAFTSTVSLRPAPRIWS